RQRGATTYVNASALDRMLPVAGRRSSKHLRYVNAGNYAVIDVGRSGKVSVECRLLRRNYQEWGVVGPPTSNGPLGKELIPEDAVFADPLDVPMQEGRRRGHWWVSLTLNPSCALIQALDRVGAHRFGGLIEHRQRLEIRLGDTPGGQLVYVVPFGDQETLWRCAFDPFDVRAAHEVDAARGFDRFVGFRYPLLAKDVLIGQVDFGDLLRSR